jgi:hypothetical protein
VVPADVDAARPLAGERRQPPAVDPEDHRRGLDGGKAGEALVPVRRPLRFERRQALADGGVALGHDGMWWPADGVLLSGIGAGRAGTGAEAEDEAAARHLGCEDSIDVRRPCAAGGDRAARR